MGIGDPHYLERVETHEYQANYDDLLAKYSPEILENALLGIFWGISTNPDRFEHVTGAIYRAQTESHSSEVPDFRVYFSVLNHAQVLMLWIEEVGEEMGL